MAPRAAAPPDVSHDPQALAEPLRTAVLWLMANGNVTLTSGRRSTDAQFRLRGQNGCAGREMDRSCKGHPTTAIPGTSKHETGEAADLGGDLAFVRANADRLGIYPAVPGEAWHWQAKGPSTSGNQATGDGITDLLTGAAGVVLPGLGGAVGVADGFARLTDPHTLWRVTLVVGGAALIIVGVLQVTGGLKVLTSIYSPGGKVALAADLVKATA